MTEVSEGHGESSPGTKWVLYQLTIEEVISVTSFSITKFVGYYRIHVKFRAFRKATIESWVLVLCYHEPEKNMYFQDLARSLILKIRNSVRVGLQ